MPPVPPRTDASPNHAALVVAIILLAAHSPLVPPSAAVSLPYCSGTGLVGAAAEIDSALVGVELKWEVEPNDSAKAALEAALRTEATRRGYAIGAAESKSRWVFVRRAEPTADWGPGEPPLTTDGYAAALADRIRRASPRSVAPTRAALGLQVMLYDVAIWTGEARFDPDPEDPIASADAALRALVGVMPRFGRRTASFERVAAESVAAYYATRLEGRWFFCPVLPYPVRFPDLERAYHQGGRTVRWEDTVNSHEHEDATIFPACLDLILHAESALPKQIPGFVDVAAAELWRDVTLFDVYRDASGAEVNVEVRLRGDTRGYKVDETRVLDAKEAATRREAQQLFKEASAAVFGAEGR